jgi:hypothetical protein
VPYGQAIYRCNQNGDIALTYDDGPYTYTEDLLDLLAVRCPPFYPCQLTLNSVTAPGDLLTLRISRTTPGQPST